MTAPNKAAHTVGPAHSYREMMMKAADRMLLLKYPALSQADRERVAERAASIMTSWNGDVRAAYEMACSMCGNVSLSARASMAPVADFLGWWLDEVTRDGPGSVRSLVAAEQLGRQGGAL